MAFKNENVTGMQVNAVLPENVWNYITAVRLTSASYCNIQKVGLRTLVLALIMNFGFLSTYYQEKFPIMSKSGNLG